MRKSDLSYRRLETDLLSLRTLVAIAEEGSFSAAARRIGRSQSAVSLQVAKLEDQLGARLLHRTSRSVKQTRAGETLIAYARKILALADEAALAVASPKGGPPFRIGCADYLAPGNLHDLLGRFRRAHPRTDLKLRLGPGTELRAALEAGDLDVLIAGPDGGEGGLVLRTEPMVWIGAPEDGFDAPGPVPLVLMGAPCSYRKMALEALSAAGKPFRITMEANSIQGVQAAVRGRIGISAVAGSATAGLPVLERGAPPLPRTAIVVFPGRDAHPLADRFVDFLADGLGTPALMDGVA